MSIYSYTVIGAALPTPITIAIPATTIDIQEGQNIIQFDLSQVEIGKYSDIQNIDLRMDIPTEAQTIYMDTLRNTITTSIGQPESTNMIHIPLSKDGEDMRTIHPEFLS